MDRPMVFTVEPDDREPFAVPGTATVAELFAALEGEFPTDPPRGVVLTAVPILPVGLCLDDER